MLKKVYCIDVLQIVCICIWISTCSSDVVYSPHDGPFYKAPIYKGIYKGPYYKGIYKGPYYKGFSKGPIYNSPIYDYHDDEYPYPIEYTNLKGEFVDEKKETWLDYWNTFKEIFLQSYADLKKPYVVERPVPVPIEKPVPVPGRNSNEIFTK